MSFWNAREVSWAVERLAQTEYGVDRGEEEKGVLSVIKLIHFYIVIWVEFKFRINVKMVNKIQN